MIGVLTGSLSSEHTFSMDDEMFKNNVVKFHLGYQGLGSSGAGDGVNQVWAEHRRQILGVHLVLGVASHQVQMKHQVS